MQRYPSYPVSTNIYTRKFASVPADTIRIPLSDDTWTQIENLMQSNVGTGLTLKDIEGADVHLLRVTKNMKPGIYFRNKKRKSISISIDNIKGLLVDCPQ